MIKVAFLGDERIGKTTQVYKLAHQLQSSGIETVISKEVIHDLPSLPLYKVESQLIFVFSQIIEELKFSLYSEDRVVKPDVLLIDKTPLDTMRHLLNVIGNDSRFTFWDSLQDLIKKYILSYDIIVVLNDFTNDPSMLRGSSKYYRNFFIEHPNSFLLNSRKIKMKSILRNIKEKIKINEQR